MKKMSKREALNFFKNLPSNQKKAFNLILNKLREFRTNEMLLRMLNIRGYSPETFKIAKTELSKNLQISENELKQLGSKMNVYKGVNALLDKKEIIEKAVSLYPTTLDSNLGDIKKKNEVFKLREEFPFLDDEKTPDVFKILVADKITIFNKLQELREKLGNEKDMNLEEATVLNKEVKQLYDENKQMWEELNHFKEHGEILGKHPLFEKLEIQKKVDSMSPADLHKRAKNVATYITKNKQKLQANPDDEKAEQWKERLELYEHELKIVNARLGVQNSKSGEEE